MINVLQRISKNFFLAFGNIVKLHIILALYFMNTLCMERLRTCSAQFITRHYFYVMHYNSLHNSHLHFGYILILELHIRWSTTAHLL